MEFGPEKAFDGKRLINHVIRIAEVMVTTFCENVCYMEPDCVSINLDKRADGDGTYKCELNVTHEGREDELKEEENYFYHAAEASNTSSNINVWLHSSVDRASHQYLRSSRV